MTLRPGARVVAVVLIGITAGACTLATDSIRPDPVGRTTSPAAAAQSAVAPPDGCPALATKAPGAPSAVQVDYVDFLIFDTASYLARTEPEPPVIAADLGEIVMRSQCSFRDLNDRTGLLTPTPSDGQTAYLAPGTPVYAIRGWPPSCRLAAEHHGALHLYAAEQGDGTGTGPAACQPGDAPT